MYKYYQIIGAFEPVTEHFGYRLEVRYGSPMCVIYRNNCVKHDRFITGRYSKKLAIQECYYLELLNYGRNFSA